MPQIDPRIAQALFQRSYVRPETIGGLGTSAPVALLQMLDPKGFTPAQMDQNRAMRSSLMDYAGRNYGPLPPQSDNGSAIAQRNSLDEDLNSVLIKYNNWRKQGVGQELTPQERVTQGFIDVRNPNSWF